MPIDLMPEAWQKALLLPLIGLFLLEGTDNDFKSARAQAINLIAGFMPATELEFRLSVRIAILNIQTNRAFAWAGLEETTIPQAISLQRNGLALMKAADEAQSRLLQLQAQRIERTRQAPAQKPAATTTSQPETSQPRPTANDAKAINEYARAHNMTYAQAWGAVQRARKAAQAQEQPQTA